jgi:flagellar basal-body rod protein FlgB
MANDITVEAVRLALGLQQLRAEVASSNIALANTPGHQVQRLEMGSAKALLRQAAMPGVGQSLFDSLASLSSTDLASVVADPSAAAAQPDSQVAEMVAASLDYQSLAESLNRHFGLMRLAVSGRSGA